MVIGYTSLYKIDQLIKNKKVQDTLPNNKKELYRLICKKLLQPYQEYINYFLKVIFDTLPPYYKGIDYNIILKGDSRDLAPSLLYNILLEQLELIKAYLQEHLQKGFIILSDTPFIAPVLFTKKLGGEQRFYINF